MKHPSVRRGAATLVATVASVALVAGTPTAASAAVKPGPSRAAADWLAGEVNGGVISSSYVDQNGDRQSFDDYGLTADVFFALDTTHTKDTKRAAIVKALKQNVNKYTTSHGDASAGATAKLLVLADESGAKPRDFGGVNLVKRLSSLQQDGGADDGRFADGAATDYASTLAQALGVTGLAQAGKPSKAATHFLLKQQCDKGYFRLEDNDKATNQKLTCAGGKGSGDSDPDVDVTAYALKALLAARKAGTTGVGGDIKDAKSWLASAQHKNGAFGGAGPTSGANSNSTGLAGDALAAAGKDGAAADAARWLKGLQLGGAAPKADQGAVAYDRAAYRDAKDNGITKATRDQFRRATAQATLGLTHLRG